MSEPTPDPLTQEIIGLVVGLGERMRMHFAQVTFDVGLSPMEGRALFELEDPQAMGELARGLGCDASYVTGITDSLEARGLVRRRIDSNDRRIKHLVLTHEGKELRDTMKIRAEEDLPATVGLDREQKRALRDLLRSSSHHGAQEMLSGRVTAARTRGSYPPR